MPSTKHRTRGPSGGYDFPNKDMYRRWVWNAFREYVNPQHSQCLLMPSREGFEIDVAMSKGFREEHMHIVDDNPANVAVLKRRYRNINTYGVAASRACFRIRKAKQRLDVANFDFTGCLGHKLNDELLAIAGTQVLSQHSTVAVTLLRGREQPRWFESIQRNVQARDMGDDIEGIAKRWKALGPRWSCVNVGRRLTKADWGRLSLVMTTLGAFGGTFRPVRAGIYPSTAGSQTMLFAVLRRDPRDLRRKLFDGNNAMFFYWSFLALNGQGMSKTGRLPISQWYELVDTDKMVAWMEVCGHKISNKHLRAHQERRNALENNPAR